MRDLGVVSARLDLEQTVNTEAWACAGRELLYSQMLLSPRLVNSISESLSPSQGLPRGLFLLFFQTVSLWGRFQKKMFSQTPGSVLTLKGTLAMIIIDNNYCC